MLKKRLFMAGAALVGLLITAMLVAAAIWPVINDVKTGETREYNDLQPLYYTADPARVFDESKGSVEAMERWEVVKSDVATRTIDATATSRVFGFADDVTVSVHPVTEFVTRVDVRSRSRVGKGDFGQNARNIKAFFEALDERLGAVRFDPSQNSASASGASATSNTTRKESTPAPP